MSNAPKNASERAFQENFVKELEKYKWEAPDYLNGNKKKVTVSDLINHWRGELNRINADQLEGVELTDNEFAQVMTKVGQISNSYEAAKILSIEESKGKIDGIYRDDNPNITRKQITLTILKKAEVRGGDSSYRVAREVVTSNDNRFDIVLLINGLPLINIEQKRTDKSLDEAYGQFIRYYRDGEYCNNFMAFSQMMVIATEIETRYFATPKSINDFNPAFAFHWADKENKSVNNWQKVIEHFLMIPMAHQMVGDYLVIDEAKEEENRKHMLMRPYQVYALQAVEGAAFGWDNDGIPHGGFVWHTTGSGKTITSFKTALFLSTRVGFDKVVFLVDRRELDRTTSDNFKAYAAYEPVMVDDTKHTYQLKKQLKLQKSGIIVTTTFKLNVLVKELEEAQDNTLADKRIVFIIDEAHRTTMGQMMGVIKNHFRKNGLFYGFTGTPLFDENNIKGKINEKSEVINTTEKLFGPKLHQYTIDEAISDGNVLGFYVDYINTGEFKSYDDLREQLVEKIKEEHPELADREIERKVQEWSEAKVEMQASKRNILTYQDETHIPRVVEEILNNWEAQSQEREFNAILTVAYKSRVIAFYNEFKKQLNERGEKLNIVMTFSFGNENDPDNISPAIIEGMFKDYSEFTGIEFIAGDKKHWEDAYFEDVVERATRGGSGRNKKNIDLVIVADQLLTGYDSKRLNTLYVDRSLELQGLIQAYSRTNRVFGKNKEFGTIVNFQYPRLTKQTVETALKLYGSGGSSSKAIVDTYIVAVEKFRISVLEMVESLPDPSEWQELKDDKEGKEKFITAFKDAAEQLNLVEQYYEYKWDDDTFGIEEHTWLKYVGAYKNLTRKEGSGDPVPIIIKPLVGKTKLAGTQVIDAAHILGLIGSKVSNVGGIQTVDGETLRIIYEQIQELSDMGEDNKAHLLKEFVDTELVPGNLSYNLNFDDAFDIWKQDKLKANINDLADIWGIDRDWLFKSVNAFSVAQAEVIPYIDELTKSVDYDKATDKSAGNKLKHMMTLMRKLPGLIAEMKQKYD
ncbi:type I restriction endonuclease subunit R, EcoR124 family [Clostridium botulinum]|uniref:type I restriction endonuclease subunit R, EcoR124 family n=1 Tax=Clostridium botulinum TaxID=1491 RepID=UPI0007747A08|nr:HsdR family type I site-specific deoxyribonuclease [Clostridium botulinum]MBY6950151.1 type I restriction endonuclease subunit R [Clostridium botulinum]MCR1138397.1 HsdR family type I site-specific deoxyribonuclease [Clostridium botulinum]NEZ78823.1 type I restriction endonuclease subunit R [Clostridium botulinum]NFA15026.1 type I restriction endonuclease subunit R [Clostridium botulinum]NFA52538.1 type I restriction endonuclease subunit R [Clostridium botulinum]